MHERPPRGSRPTALLFPAEPRSFPYRRTVRTVLRTAHILAGGVLLGGNVFGVHGGQLESWWAWTMVTGVLLLLTDLHASLAVLLEVRGVAVALKLLLVALIPLFPAATVFLLGLTLAVGGISSHMSRRYRHRVLWGRELVVTDQRRG